MNKKIPSLDGLRGFAALLVILSHTSLNKMYFFPHLDFSGFGKFGVFLFFLLSAFLLTYPFLKPEKKLFSKAAMIRYWQRRTLRIYPLYITYLLAALVSTFLLDRMANIQGVGIPFPLTTTEFLKHITLLEGKSITWSIAVEFKFYFFLPLIAWGMKISRKIHPYYPYILLLSLIILSQLISPQGSSSTNDIRLLPYTPIFITGMILAQLQTDIDAAGGIKNSLQTTVKYITALCIISILYQTPAIYSLLNENVPSDFFHKRFIQFSILWGFVLFSIINSNGILKSIFSSHILRFFGAISFSLYLFHPVLISVVNKIKADSPFDAWIVLGTTSLLACMSYYYFEKPISKIDFFKKQTCQT